MRVVFMGQEFGKLALAKPESNGGIGSVMSLGRTLPMSLVIPFGMKFHLMEHGNHR
jgi:hypothetical protein